MLKIAHRINTISQLQNTPTEFGVELDLRPEGDRIIMHHDAFKEGEDFEEWLKHYKHQLIILNTKAEGMEDRILDLMLKYEVKNYFSRPFSSLFNQIYEKGCASNGHSFLRI